MPLVRATLLSLTGAIVAFLAVLVALDGVRLPTLDWGHESRVGAFATPALREAAPTSLATLRPIPVAIAAGGALPGLSALPPPARAAPAEVPAAAPVRSAWVPPIVRRAPKEETPPAEAEPATVTAAAAEPKLAPKSPVKRLDPTTRSALGGPRPGASARPVPAARKAASAPAAKPVEPAPTGAAPIGAALGQ